MVVISEAEKLFLYFHIQVGHCREILLFFPRTPLGKALNDSITCFVFALFFL